MQTKHKPPPDKYLREWYEREQDRLNRLDWERFVREKL